MQRLRPLNEQECYIRCYGWRGRATTPYASSDLGDDEPEAVGGHDGADPARVRGARRRGSRARAASRSRQSAAGRPVDSVRTRALFPDVLAPGLTAIFCGINPGRVSAAANAHFANPRNDFWRLLHAAGFTPRLDDPGEQFELSRSARRHQRRLSHHAGLRATCARPTSPAPPSGSSGSRSSSRRARSASSARRHTAAPSASGRSSGCKSAASARRRSSCSRRPRPPTQRCRGTSGCGGFGPSGALPLKAPDGKRRASLDRRAVLLVASSSARSVWATPAAARGEPRGARARLAGAGPPSARSGSDPLPIGVRSAERFLSHGFDRRAASS